MTSNSRPSPHRLSVEAPKDPARREPVEHLKLHRAAHVELRRGVDDGDRCVAAPAHHCGLDGQAVPPARADIGRLRRRLRAREHPREVARARAVPCNTPRGSERRRGVVDLERHPSGEDRAQGGREDRAREVGGEFRVQVRGEGVARVGLGVESGVRD